MFKFLFLTLFAFGCTSSNPNSILDNIHKNEMDDMMTFRNFDVYRDLKAPTKTNIKSKPSIPIMKPKIVSGKKLKSGPDYTPDSAASALYSIKIRRTKNINYKDIDEDFNLANKNSHVQSKKKTIKHIYNQCGSNCTRNLKLEKEIEICQEYCTYKYKQYTLDYKEYLKDLKDILEAHPRNSRKKNTKLYFDDIKYSFFNLFENTFECQKN